MGTRENIELDIIGKTVKPTDKPLGDEFADKLRWSALGTIASAAIAASPILPALLRKKVSFKEAYKLKKVPVAVSGMAGAAFGWNAPSVHNKYLEYIQKKVPKENAQEAYSELVGTTKRVQEEAPLFFKKSSYIEKRALLSTFAKRFVIGTGKAIGTGVAATTKGATKFIGKGLAGTPKTIPSIAVKGGYRRSVLGGIHTWGVRGGVGALGAAGLMGASRLYQARKKLSGQNYTTFLRNNILAGNIKPEQLSQEDLVAVRKLGMR